MAQHLLKAVTLVLAAAAVLAPLSVSAGDYRDDRDHHHGHKPFRHYGPVSLRQISWPQHETQARDIRIVLPEERRAGSGDTYAGNTSVYQADGGTYVLADGYSIYRTDSAPQLRPKAKVIDLRLARSACSYEMGVCVIRP
ncbi:MAG: hypothetical protein KGI75_02425 [Rhizobiaceae bacterium]|nr:hypothetical protein [Rhizobiaceae bacterium]